MGSNVAEQSSVLEYPLASKRACFALRNKVTCAMRPCCNCMSIFVVTLFIIERAVIKD